MNKLTLLRNTLLSLGSVMVLAVGACSSEEIDSDTHSTTEGAGRAGAATGGASDDESSGGTDRSENGGTSGSAGEAPETGGSGGEEVESGGSAGATGTAETAGTAGVAGTAGTAGTTQTAGTAGTAGTTQTAGTAGTAGTTQTAGTAGTAGSTATAGTAGSAAGAGGNGAEVGCFGDTRTLNGEPSDWCANLPFAATCSDGSAPLGVYLCDYFAAHARPGVFDAMYTCLFLDHLDDLGADGCANHEHNIALGCLDTVMAGACDVDRIVPDQSDVTCELIVNGNDGTNGGDFYEACSDIEVNGTASASITKCQQTFNLFNEAARAQIYDCHLCYSAPGAEDMTCGELFDECAFPDVEPDSLDPYPYTEPNPDATWCEQ